MRPEIAGLASAIAWLADRGIAIPVLAHWFETNQNHVRQLLYRGRHGRQKPLVHPWLVSPLTPPKDPFVGPDRRFKEQLGLRKQEDTVHLYRRHRRRIADLEEKIEIAGAQFWGGVRFGTGIKQLRLLRQEIGYVAHVPRIRLRARLEHLIAETHVHLGMSASALDLGLRALHLWRVAWAESQDKADLKDIARTALLLSQAHLLRLEPTQACGYLDLHEHASRSASFPLAAEFHRQRGAMHFQNGDWTHARPEFHFAAELLAEVTEYGKSKQLHEVLNIGERQMNLLPPVNWERGLELLDYMESHLSPGDIHRSMNLHWTVACGFATDDPKAHIRAQELLEGGSGLSSGFGHQATIFRLLSLTPDLPLALRADWVRHALYENAFSNS